MTLIEPDICPHCGAAAAVSGAQFCSACGMALPSARSAGPRVVDGRNPSAATAAGLKLRGDELLVTAKRAARSLLSVGLVNLAFAAFYAYLISQQPRLLHVPFVVALFASMAVAGGIYVGLYFWANVHPLSATIAGLVVYVLKWGVDIGISHLLPARSGTTSGATSNYYFFRVLMVIYLIRGIAAAVRHRTLLRQQAAGPAPVPVLAAD